VLLNWCWPNTPGPLRQAGVPVVAVRYGGIIHDFVMLDALRGTQAAEAAIGQAVAVPRQALGAEPATG
jgi:hypothetical protein